MKILAFAPWVPGVTRPRSLALLSHLAERHEVLLVACVWSAEDADALDRLVTVKTVGVRLNRICALARVVRGIFKKAPFQVSYVRSRKIRRYMKFISTQFRPDILYFNVARGAGVAEHCLSSRIIVDLDEFRSKYFQIASEQSSNPLVRWIYAHEASRLREFESKTLGRAELVLVSSPVDVRENVRNVQLVRTPYLASFKGKHEPNAFTENIVFVGRQSYSANIDGIMWFIDNVWGALSNIHPGAVLHIVGRDPGRRLRARSGPNVRVWGQVEDVGVHYAAARASIVPIWRATGVQMKLIESLAYGVPTVVTPLVSTQAGLDVDVCMVASDPAEWVDALHRVLTDHRLCKSLRRSGMSWVRRYHSPESVFATLDAAIR